MKQHITEVSAKTLTEVIERSNNLLKLIEQSTLHTIIQDQNKYRAIIVFSYNSPDQFKKIKDGLSYLEIKWS